jgi:hypothetical protein
MKLSTRFRKLTFWNKLGAIGSVCSILGFAGWLLLRDPGGIPVTVDDSPNGNIQTAINSPNAVQQNMENSPGGIQVAGDLNMNGYRPISSELRATIKQNLSAFSASQAGGFCVIIRVEAGDSLRQRVARELGELLSSANLGNFPRGNTNIGVAPEHPITVWCTKNQLAPVRSFLAAIAPYVKGEMFIDVSKDDGAGTVTLYLNGIPVFSPDGSVVFQ